MAWNRERKTGACTKIAGKDDVPPPVLTVCVSLKNRSRILYEGRELQLFPNCVHSLAKVAKEIGPIELVVADFHSDDWSLDEWVYEAAGSLQLKVIPVEGNFSRGRGLNIAARHATSDRLFLCDADILIGSQAMRRAIEIIDAGKAWLPVCCYLDKQGQPAYWQDAGYGLAGMSKRVFEQTEGLPEFESWGGEDEVLRDAVAEHVKVVRERAVSLLHQWHPGPIRHEHYAKASGTDYTAHMAELISKNIEGPPIRTFFGEHPYWQDKICLYTDGRMARPGVDTGDYEWEIGHRLLLKWDHWDEEELLWDDTEEVYRDVTKPFILREFPAQYTLTSRQIRVNYANFWPGFNVDDYRRAVPGEEYDFVVSESPQIVFESVFGQPGEGRRRWPNALQVWFTGENISPPLEDYDYCVSFCRDLDDSRHLRWPLFLLRLQQQGLCANDLLHKPNGMLPYERPKFCAFIASNGTVEIRNRFVRRLCEYKQVDCPGAVLNNMPQNTFGPPKNVRQKIEFLKEYKFAVCFENCATRGSEGYVTEKVVDAMLAGCIPLYWGDHRVGEDFNTQSFVNLNRFEEDIEAMVELVISIDQDAHRSRSIAKQPWFSDNMVPPPLTVQAAEQFFRRIFESASR